MKSAVVPIEKEEAIRNMAGLPPKTVKTTDKAVELFKKHDKNLDEFTKAVSNLINVTVDEKELITFDKQQSLDKERGELNEKKWVKNTYNT